ncbi:DUF3570 domain-containing protein [Woeseia oceani]|uniref:DUF3570 domain-containing protein n=1 Tax=Woeseia oceani TaxID=1548547 RepID=A0A193LJQ3_9GAMM|nr:DUF3570 domain-containing protein [Woeseia oceani]ANO52686.1 hypothetical protein BA177_17150 [Woeseia oceani]
MKKDIARTLAAATCSLLGSATLAPLQAQEEPNWDFNTALLYYGESDSRVQDISLNVLARRTFNDDRSLSLGLAVDSLTGATPSGALPMPQAQTFTSPSGDASYTVAAGEHPLDNTFLDTRYALNAAWTQPLGRLYNGTAGVSFSKEYDYTHFGANFGLSRDFNKRNTTLSLGLAFSQDDIEPVGGAPVPLSSMLEVGNQNNKLGDDSKDVVDLLIGITQVINERLVLRANYSFSDASGYLNDPYKILSVVDGLSGDTIALAPSASGPSHAYRFESRPDSRGKHSLYGQAKYFMNGKVLDVSYRYMTDDWGVDSHTLDGRLRVPFGERSYLEPHLRFYTQTEADFYRASLTDGEPLPMYAASDYRLGSFDAITAGLKYGWETKAGHDAAVRLEYYKQTGDVPDDQVIGNQRDRDLYPGLDAIVLNFSYRFGL